MKTLSFLKTAISATVLAGMFVGCSTDGGLGPQALDTLARAVLVGALTYEQTQAAKRLAKEEEGSVECAPGECVTEGPAAPTVFVPATGSGVSIPATGHPVIAVLGDATTCAWTRKFLALSPEAAIEEAFAGSDMIYADRAANAAAFARYRPVAGFSFPLVRVFGADGKVRGEFVARGLAMQIVINKIKGLL